MKLVNIFLSYTKLRTPDVSISTARYSLHIFLQVIMLVELETVNIILRKSAIPNNKFVVSFLPSNSSESESGFELFLSLISLITPSLIVDAAIYSPSKHNNELNIIVITILYSNCLLLADVSEYTTSNTQLNIIPTNPIIVIGTAELVPYAVFN